MVPPGSFCYGMSVFIISAFILRHDLRSPARRHTDSRYSLPVLTGAFPVHFIFHGWNCPSSDRSCGVQRTAVSPAQSTLFAAAGCLRCDVSKSQKCSGRSRELDLRQQPRRAIQADAPWDYAASGVNSRAARFRKSQVRLRISEKRYMAGWDSLVRVRELIDKSLRMEPEQQVV